LRGPKWRAKTKAWLKPRSRKRSEDKGMGTTHWASSRAGSMPGACCITWASERPMALSPSNFKRAKQVSHGYP